MRKHWLAIATILLLTFGSNSSHAQQTRGGWGNWWLPPDYSTHGWAMDSLFNWIFWITMITFILVEVVLVVFLIKYRARPGVKKAHFTHGNTRLEMAWTIAPAIILALLALFSKKVWDDYRYSPAADDPNKATVLVIGEQFKWNVIYPGPNGKLGAYLKFPKPGDPRWQNPDGSGKDFSHAGVTGPAELPYDEAVKACNSYITNYNKLGKDFDDEAGKDDNWVPDPGRALILPKDRPIEVQLGSKDVLHDFFLPNFRVKLDAVPGMRGKLHFTSTVSSSERERAARKVMTLDELTNAMKTPANSDLSIVVEGMPNAEKDNTGWRFKDKNAKNQRQATIIRHAASIPTDPDKFTAMVTKLRENGIDSVTVYKPVEWELVCEELCGANHYSMRNVVRFLENDEYDALKFDKPNDPSATPRLAVGAAK